MRESYREILLSQEEPLEGHEITTLEEWLVVLQGDVEAFGETPEDVGRMQAIEARIEKGRRELVTARGL